MFIRNITRGPGRENIILTSLKNDIKEEDLVIQPGNWIDTQTYCITDQKVNRSHELNQFIKNGKLELLQSLPEDDATARKMQEDAQEYDKADFMNTIASTFNMSLLEDLLQSPKVALDVKQAARDRLIDLNGGMPENEELKDKPNNPIV